MRHNSLSRHRDMGVTEDVMRFRCCVRKLPLVAIAFVATPEVLSAASVTETRMIPDNITLAVPLFPCAVPTMAVQLARSAGIPAGIESVSDCAHGDPAPPRNLPPTITFLGKTVAEALDELIALDPRYRWTESDGVILVRPLDAWNDAHHFLHETIVDFGFENQNIVGASVLLAQAMQGRPFRPPTIDTQGRTEQGDRHFSMAPRTSSIVGLMNDVVRANGSMYWTINYCRPLRDREHASFMLWTFDRSGFGTGPLQMTGPDGKPRIDCPPPSNRK